MLLFAIPLFIAAWYIGKRLRSRGFRFHIRQLALVGGSGASVVLFLDMVSVGDSVGAAVAGAAVGAIGGSLFLIAVCLIGNVIRGEGHEHYYPW